MKRIIIFACIALMSVSCGKKDSIVPAAKEIKHSDVMVIIDNTDGTSDTLNLK
jgi:hypothetical protein